MHSQYRQRTSQRPHDRHECSYICGRLLSIGIPVVNAYTVGDDIKQIVRALKRAAEDADIVIVTGGLGLQMMTSLDRPSLNYWESNCRSNRLC